MSGAWRASKAAGARVVLVGMQVPPNYGAKYGQEVRELFATVAREQKAALVPFFLKGVADGADIGGAAHVRAVEPAEAQVHVVDDGDRAHACGVTGAEIAVDIVLAEPRILQRALGALRMDLGQRDILREPRRMLIDSRDIGLALDETGEIPVVPLQAVVHRREVEHGHAVAELRRGGRRRDQAARRRIDQYAPSA